MEPRQAPLRAVPASAPAYAAAPPPPPPATASLLPGFVLPIAAFAPPLNVTTTLVTGLQLDSGFAYAPSPSDATSPFRSSSHGFERMPC